MKELIEKIIREHVMSDSYRDIQGEDIAAELIVELFTKHHAELIEAAKEGIRIARTLHIPEPNERKIMFANIVQNSKLLSSLTSN